MLFCYKCGKKLSESDKYCLKCGARVFNPEEIEILLSKTDEITAKQDNTASEDVKEKTAAALPKKKKSKAEAFMQFMTILFAVFALIIVTVVGSMLISSHLEKNELGAGSEDVNTASMEDSATSKTSSVSSRSTKATKTTVTTKQTQKNGLIVYDKAEMKKKILGTWTTEIEYKSMTVPGTIKFSSGGKCSLSVSALFISKKFEGTYTVGDNGRCVMNLPGLDEFIENKNTISGKASFYNDNKVKFVTDGGNVLTLTRS